MPNKVFIFWLEEIEKYLVVEDTGRLYAHGRNDGETLGTGDITLIRVGIKENLDSDNIQNLENPLVETPPGKKENKLTNDKRRVLFFLAVHCQNGLDGVSTAFLNMYHKNGEQKVSYINSFFNDNFQFRLISRAPYKINGIKIERPREFSIDDFFDVFSSSVSTIKFGNETYKINKLTDDQKRKILFGICGGDFDTLNTNDTLNNFYKCKAIWINTTKTSEVFNKIRLRLKGLLDYSEIYGSEYKTLEEAADTLKKGISKQIENSLNNWKENIERSLFPQLKAKNYYPKYRESSIKKLESKEIATPFKPNWVSPFSDYDFSEEDQCIDIDDIIVSFALLALSNYKTDDENAELQKKRTTYKTAVERLIQERFAPPDDNYQYTGNYIPDVFYQVIKGMLKKGFSEEEMIKMINRIISEQKIIENNNEYNNEGYNHSITK